MLTLRAHAENQRLQPGRNEEADEVLGHVAEREHDRRVVSDTQLTNEVSVLFVSLNT